MKNVRSVDIAIYVKINNMDPRITIDLKEYEDLRESSLKVNEKTNELAEVKIKEFKEEFLDNKAIPIRFYFDFSFKVCDMKVPVQILTIKNISEGSLLENLKKTFDYWAEEQNITVKRDFEKLILSRDEKDVLEEKMERLKKKNWLLSLAVGTLTILCICLFIAAIH